MSDMIDNLDIDLSGVDLKRPLIDNQVVTVRLGDLRVEDDRLLIPMTLEEPATSTTGRQVNVGFQFTESIFLKPGANSKDPEKAKGMIAERLAKFQAAVLKLDKPEPTFGSLSRYSGLLVKAKLGLREDQKDPEVQYQTVKAWIKAS